MFLPKSGIWPILCQLMAILAKSFEILTSNLFCHPFTLTLIYKLILKSIRPKLAIMSPKITKMAISQNPILPECHLPKRILLLHFTIHLSKTFRINVNMDFAHTYHGRKNNFDPVFAPRPHMGNIARIDPKPPTKCRDVSWPFPPTPSSK